jgi:NADH-quinone oxidoreductase subunit C
MSDTPAEAGATGEAATGRGANDTPAQAGTAGASGATTAGTAGAAPPGEDTGAGDETAADGSSTSDGSPDGGPTTLHGCPLDARRRAAVVHCNRADYLPLMTALKADGYDLPVGVTGVDYLTHPGRDLPPGIVPERFEVVVELLSLTHRRRLRVRCQVPAHDPSVPTLFDLWPGTEAHERETYDMFGIRFAGHPDPSRILMPEDWEGHPLRKDYDTGHIPVKLKEAPK